MSLSKTLLKIFIWLFLFFTAGTGIVLSSVYLYLSPNLPSVESIREVKLQIPLRIFSADGKLIGEFGEKRRTPIRLSEVPPNFINALLAAEDANFYSHKGVSIKGLARAVSQVITTGKKGSGGSTLTMQLTRHVFLNLNQTFTRKFNEILLALRIEKELSKDEILELYINYMFLGKRAYGINAASFVYYGKPLNELSLAQLTMIAGLFQGPSTQNPIVNPERAIERRNWILGRMHELEMIDSETLTTYQAKPVTAKYHETQYDVNAPYVAELARDKAIRTFGLKAYTQGYRVYTTIDSRLQIAAQDAVFQGLLSYDKRHGYRGPEEALDLKGRDFNELTDDNTSIVETLSKLSVEYEDWLDVLSSTPTYGNLIPGAVLSTQGTKAHILLEGPSVIELELDPDMIWARPYISENNRGPTPKAAGDIVSAGDVIRIREIDDRWKLAQIPAAQAAVVALNPKNGAMQALVGGFDFNHSNFNRATQAARQPGSNFKPFIYTAALENGMTAASIVNDAPVVYQDALLEDEWRPENDSGTFNGPTRLRKALYKSMNTASIRVLESVGIGKALTSLERFGFKRSKLPRDLSLVLGTMALTPVDIATGYAAFANGGYKVNPHLIDRIIDFNGHAIYNSTPDTVCHNCDDLGNEMLSEEVYNSANDELIGFEASALYDQELENDPFDFPFGIKSLLDILDKNDYPRAKQIISDEVAFIMDSILQDVVKRGTGYKVNQLKRRDLAGKTGTTNGPTDVWFSGYNNELVATAWVGFDNNTNLGVIEFGSTAALPIWMDLMSIALKSKTNTQRQQPDGIVSVRINPETGLQARPDDPDAIFEYFRVNMLPELDTQTATSSKSIIEDTVTEELF